MAPARRRCPAAIANVINLGADLGAMGAALGLLIGGPELLYAALFGAICSARNIHELSTLCATLKWATLCLFAYVAWSLRACAMDRAHQHLSAASRLDAPHAMAWLPSSVRDQSISVLLAAGQEVEELHRRHVNRFASRRASRPELSRIRTDTPWNGISNLIALFIMFATAAILTQRRHRYPNIVSSGRGSRPIAGAFPSRCSRWLIATGMLAVPVLAALRLCGQRIFRCRKAWTAAQRGEAFYATMRSPRWWVALKLHILDPSRRSIGARCQWGRRASDGRHDGHRHEPAHHGPADTPRPMAAVDGSHISSYIRAVAFFRSSRCVKRSLMPNRINRGRRDLPVALPEMGQRDVCRHTTR